MSDDTRMVGPMDWSILVYLLAAVMVGALGYVFWPEEHRNAPHYASLKSEASKDDLRHHAA